MSRGAGAAHGHRSPRAPGGVGARAARGAAAAGDAAAGEAVDGRHAMIYYYHQPDFGPRTTEPWSARCSQCGKQITREEWASTECPGAPTEHHETA